MALFSWPNYAVIVPSRGTKNLFVSENGKEADIIPTKFKAIMGYFQLI